MTPKRIAIAFLACALASPTASNAGLITWELEGTIEQVVLLTEWGDVPNPNAGEVITQLDAAGVIPGASWRGRIAFDSDAIGVRCEECSDFNRFEDAAARIEFLAGSFAASTPDGAPGKAWAGTQGADPSEGSILSFEAPMATDSAALLADSANLVFSRVDPTAPFPSALPTEPPDLSTLAQPAPRSPFAYFIGTRFYLVGHGFPQFVNPYDPNLGAQLFLIDGRISSITRVPEPAAFALVLAAAGAIAIRRRSRALP